MAVLVALAAVVVPAVPALSLGATTTGASTAGPDPNPRQAAASGLDAVVLRIAGLAQQEQAAEAAVTGSELAATRIQQDLAGLRQRVTGLLAAAYIDDGGGNLALEVPEPYLAAARDSADALLTRYQRALVAARTARSAGQSRLEELGRLRAALERQRRVLADLVDARQAAIEQRGSPDAAALAAGDQARINADAAAPTPISMAATQAQLALMSRFPFGPLAVGQTGPRLPPGLVATGQAVAGVASWYGPGFDGRPTASGAVYDENGWTVASPNLPLGTFLVVSVPGRALLLLVNDRGPYVAGRVLDLSHAAAVALGSDGLIDVHAEVVVPQPGA